MLLFTQINFKSVISMINCSFLCVINSSFLCLFFSILDEPTQELVSRGDVVSNCVKFLFFHADNKDSQSDQTG